MTLSRVAVPAGVLCVFGLTLPVSLPHDGRGVSRAECLAIADATPEPRANATPILERCSAVLPHDVEILAELGARYESSGVPAQAETMYRRALAVDPGYAELRLRLARLLLKRGAAADARREAEAALRVQPNRRALLNLLREASRTPAGAPR